MIDLLLSEGTCLGVEELSGRIIQRVDEFMAGEHRPDDVYAGGPQPRSGVTPVSLGKLSFAAFERIIASASRRPARPEVLTGPRTRHRLRDRAALAPGG